MVDDDDELELPSQSRDSKHASTGGDVGTAAAVDAPPSHHQTEQQEVQLELERALKWTKMMAKWDGVIKKNSKKVTCQHYHDNPTINQVKTRCEKGIPPRVRGQAWKLLTRSTPDLLPIRKVVQYRVRLSVFVI